MYPASRDVGAINNTDTDIDDIAEDRDTANVIVYDTPQCLKARHVLGVMGFLGFANVYAMRVNLSVAIVAMVNATQPDLNDTIDVCPQLNPSGNSTPAQKPGEFNWSESEQGIMLGAFFYGYVLTQIPGGRIAELFGGKLVFGFGVLFTALFTLLSPAAAYYSFPAFIVIRVLEGLAEGVTFPAMHAMLARWIPPTERSKFAAIVYAGTSFGTVLSLPISGWLCTLDYAGGWPLCFYLFGGLGILWFAFWIVLVFDTPISHPRICPKETEYIMWSIGPSMEKKSGPIPWGHFVRCVPLWAILVTQCGQSFQFYTLLTEMNIYMSNILHMELEKNAVLSALPYLTSWIAGVTISIFADYLVKNDYISRLNSYKFWNTVSCVIPSCGLVGVAWVGCDQTAVLLLLALTGAFGGAVYAGFQMNHMALSPQFAGTMYGITNAAGNISGFVAPYIIGKIIEGRETLSQWRVVFYLAAAVHLACNLFYLVFASAEEEEWSKQSSESASDDADTSSPLLEDSVSVS